MYIIVMLCFAGANGGEEPPPPEPHPMLPVRPITAYLEKPPPSPLLVRIACCLTFST